MKFQSLRKHRKAIVVVMGVLVWSLYIDFLLLVTSLGFHWWHPAWSVETARGLLRWQVGLSAAFGLFYSLRILQAVQACRKHGDDMPTRHRLIVAVEVCLLMTLCAAWGWLALIGHPSALPLRLMGWVWIAGTLAVAASVIYEKRRGSGVPSATPSRNGMRNKHG